MSVSEIRAPGAPEVLVSGTRPIPVPDPGEVLLKVAAAGVNRPDVFQRKGFYPPPAGASDILGLEVSGEVVALGDGVSRLSVGDKVCALLAGGGYAEYATAPEPQCLPVPAGLSMLEAAALPETYFTVWSTVFERGGLKAGETLLVHGGSSGIGTTAIQLASALGATVYATAGSKEKCRACTDLGAALAVNYKEEDFVEMLREATGGRGVDLILDMVAGSYLERNVTLAAVDGRIVIIAFLGGTRAEMDWRPVMVKRLTITGSTLRPRTVEEKGAIARALQEKVWPLLESGQVRPVISKVFPLEQAAQAHALMESSEHIGKIMLEISK
ncbi:MAG: NAD(P)H-quinone oxidoreductase [Gammaproteobacteria bacterium]|jgi:putative PIG3 family NAD(P)H quinone oxidoreductase|nr:NAD(P)H-quinone oxidoreductase [Gammaproteobacteria bacterium]